MKRIFLFVSFFTAINFIYPQTSPDYQERNLTTLKDSVKSISLPVFSATEGSIDPDIYTLGPGDNLFISISGLEEIVFNLMIDQEGNLYIPKVGGIDLRNSTLSEGRQKIIEAIYRYYKNVDVFVTLNEFRKIKVSLVGHVNKPAVLVLSANSRLMDAISSSMGLMETSDHRNITVASNNGEENKYDLLSYLRFGDKTNNPYLREGDIIIVDKVDKKVSIYGEIKYPGIYEFVEGETVSELLNLAGGFTNRARKDTIEVVSFDKKGDKQISRFYTLDQINNENIELKNQDRIIVRQIPEYYIDNYIEIEGYIRYPGWYKIIKDSTTLSEIIETAGGFLKDASLSEASLTRALGTDQYDPEYERLKLLQRADMTDDEYDYLKAKSRERTGRVVVDFERLYLHKDTSEDVILKKGDKIKIPEAKNYITLIGQVVSPGKVIFKEGLTVDNYIELAGGFAWRALEDEVRVIKANTGEWVEYDEVESLEPGDTIWIPEDPPGPKFWEVFTTVIQVTGQIASVIAATVAIIIASR